MLRTLFVWQRRRGRAAGIPDGQTGAVTFIQRFGGALNANPHMHSVVPDGLLVPGPQPDGPLVFHPLPAPTDAEVQALAAAIARRLTRVATRHLAGDDDDAWHALSGEEQVRRQAVGAALRAPVPPQPALFASVSSAKPLCASVEGFSLHAASAVADDDRAGLERLCRYGLRAPFAQSRLSLRPDGQVAYDLARPWGNTSTLVMEPVAFLKRLAALVPSPYTNLVRYHGVFANRSRFRWRLPAPPPSPSLWGPNSATTDPVAARCREAADNTDLETDPSDAGAPAPVEPPERPPARQRTPWASLLARVLGVDALRCAACSTAMTVLAFLTDPTTVRRILDHLGLPSVAPPIAPAAATHDALGADGQLDIDALIADHAPDETSDSHPRAPP